jgi:hypothetical protein
VHAWAQGATTHTLCGCGDPALFLWFFQWPATALAHGQNPFFSTALFHPSGINLLAQTSVTGLSIPLIPVTWIWGPVASLNVASTIVPALTAFTAFVVIRRWAPWTPAAFVGGLLYGFSPFVLTSLEFAHLMTAALLLLPLVLAVLDEILIRQRHGALGGGLLLGLLLFAQFFLSSEILAILGVVLISCLLTLPVAALVTRDRRQMWARLPHAFEALGIGLGLSLVLLAWPVWFALEGPGHLTGLVWPNIGVIGGFIPSSFVTAGFPSTHHSFLPLGGYEGSPLASSGYVGWSFLAVMIAGLAVFWRERRLWFFGFVLAICMAWSLGERHGQWEPAWILSRIPVVENVIEQRFMAIGFLAAALMLAIIVDRVHGALADWRGLLIALAATLVALVPMAVLFGERLPFTVESVALPRWYSDVAPTLPPDRVLLSYPAPFSGIQSPLAWQAVNRMHYSQAGGGGPEGVERRAGSAAPGFAVLATLGLPSVAPPPTGSSWQLAAVRHALSVWKVNTVVVANDGALPKSQRGRDAAYAAAFMTAALGRLPTLQAGAWVWDNVQVGQHRPLSLRPDTLFNCLRPVEGSTRRVVAASLLVPVCVARAALPS